MHIFQVAVISSVFRMQRLWESCVLSDEFIYFSKQNNEACEQLDFVIGSALYQSRWEIRINMTNGSELQVVESAKRINYHLPPASRMVIPSLSHLWWPTLVFATAAIRPITNHTWEAFGHTPVFQVRVILCLFVPLLLSLGWRAPLLLWTQNREWTVNTRGVHFIFILFCDDFIIPLCLSFSQNFVGFFFPLFLLQHYLWLAHLWSPAAWKWPDARVWPLFFRTAKDSQTSGFHRRYKSPPLSVREWAECWWLLFFPGKDVKI